MDEGARDPLQRAEALLAARRQTDAAAIAYQEAGRRPGDPLPLIVAARAELGLGDYRRAEAAATSVISLDPDCALGYRLVALARINKAYACRSIIERHHRGRAALSPAQKAVSLDSRDAASLWVLAEAAAVAGRIRLATRSADEAARLAPLLPNTWMVRARVARIAGDLPVAEADIREALRLSPDSYEANNELGLVLGAAGRRAESLSQFKSTAALDPSRQAAPRNVLRYGRGLTQLIAFVLFSPLVTLGVGVIPTLIGAFVTTALLWTWSPTRRFLERRTIELAHWRSQHSTPWWRQTSKRVAVGAPIKRHVRIKRIVALGALACGAVLLVTSVALLVTNPPNSAWAWLIVLGVAVVFMIVFVGFWRSATFRPKLHGAPHDLTTETLE